jgi:hypothetical protein
MDLEPQFDAGRSAVAVQAIMRGFITYAVLVIVTVMWCFDNSRAAPAPHATDKAVESYVFVSGAVVAPGRYNWFVGMTALDAIHVAGGFTNSASVSARILITHFDDTVMFWKYPPATIYDTNKPPVLQKDDQVYVRSALKPWSRSPKPTPIE